jgi:CBS domain-containing protein
MLTIESLMKKHVVTATAEESVADVVGRMSESSVGAVVVVDGESPVGIFSERDLVQRVVAEGKDPRSTEIGSVATRDVVTVDSGQSLRGCAEALKKHDVRHLPVVEGRRVVGIVSARDFFRAVTGELERFIEQSRYEEQLRENVDPYDHLGGSYGR